MTGLEVGLLAGGIGSSIGNLASQLYTQHKTWSREDNAVQRRMKDLIAAGLNPNLAAGSAASSSVVNAPQLNGVNAGQALDALTASEQIQQQRYATKAAKDYANLMHAQAGMANMQNNLAYGNMLFQLGLPISDITLNDNGRVSFWLDSQQSDFKTSPFFNTMQAGVDSAMYQRDLIRKENSWFTANQILNQVWNGVDAGVDIFGTALDWKKFVTPQKMQGGRDFMYDNKGRMSGYRDFKLQL